MDTPALPVGYFDEGGRYLAAVEKLGLCPSALLWAFDRVTDSFVLVLISDAFDAVGPFELSKLLFKAYKAQATPSAIDPFIIRLHSPQHALIRELETLPVNVPAGRALFKVGDATMTQIGTTAGGSVTKIGGLEINAEWVYRFEKPLSKVKTSEVLRRWHRFERNVDRAAA